MSYVLIGQVVFMISTLFVNYKVENIWGSEGFASFSLIKRSAAFIVFPLIFGAGIAIPRFISFQKNNISQSGFEYLIAGIALFLCTFFLFTISILVFPELLINSFKETTFNSTEILLGILLFVFSQGFYILFFSYYRGKLSFKYSTLLNILIMSFIPIAIIFFAKNIIVYFTLISIISLIILLGLLVYLFFKIKINALQIIKKLKQIFTFGGQRVIGEIALFSLDFLPVYLISVYIGLLESGYVSMNLLILKLAAMLFELLGSIILPYFGKIYSNNTVEYFKNQVKKLIIYGVIVSILVSIVFYYLSGFIIENFFASQSTAIEPTKILFLIFPFYVLYILLRNIIDIISDFSYNSVNLAVVVCIQLVFLFLGFNNNSSQLYHTFALVMPYSLVGILTFVTWRRLKPKI